MAGIAHRISLYQRPRQGTGFVAQHVASGYRHSILAMGGFDTASWNLQLSPSAAEQAFQNYMGLVVRVYVDNPLVPVWEGFINRITWRVGGLVLSRSFDGMMNRVAVSYYNTKSAAATKTEKTIEVDTVQSQNIFGVKQGTLDAKLHYNNANKTHKEVLRDTRKSVASWPQISVSSGDGGDGIMEFEAKGLQYFAWDWQTYTQLDPSAGGSAILANAYRAFEILTVQTTFAGGIYLPANGAFVYEQGADTGAVPRTGAYRDIAFNTAFQIQTESQGASTYLQFLQELVEAGDGTNRWVFGIGLPDPNGGQRNVYYRPANTNILYTCNALSDSGRLRDVNGAVIPGYLVRPDASVRINDILIGWDERGDDPRISYIQRIEYDAEANTVAWSNGDGADLENALQRSNSVKAYAANTPFAAPPRNNL